MQNVVVGGAAQAAFAAPDESEREHWRSVVLFGRNVASYKFALAKALLELARQGQERIEMEELAVPYTRHLCEHLLRVDRQGTFQHSRFLDACRFFNAGRITAEELRTATVLLGFNNVIDAFHVVGSGDVPTRFFVDERSTAGGIRISQELVDLAAQPELPDLEREVEARWCLVEEAWGSRAEGRQAIVLYDSPREILVPALFGKRRTITEVRPALNGYQKGHCFYCFQPITVTPGPEGPIADVDHLFPHSLMARGLPIDLDQPWNLVLACSTCNRGPGGKMAAVPHRRYLARLHRRNEYLIGSSHPLKETLVLVTGRSAAARARFLLDAMENATMLAGSDRGWTAPDEGRPLF